MHGKKASRLEAGSIRWRRFSVLIIQSETPTGLLQQILQEVLLAVVSTQMMTSCYGYLPFAVLLRASPAGNTPFHLEFSAGNFCWLSPRGFPRLFSWILKVPNLMVFYICDMLIVL